MGPSSYEEVPTLTFLSRISPFLGVLAVFLYFAVGLAANSPDLMEPQGPTVVPPFWVSAAQVYSRTYNKLSSMPRVCLWGEKANDYQQTQCDLFWNETLKVSGLALAPVGAMLILIFLLVDSQAGIYRSIRRKSKAGKADFGGVVTNPAEAEGDIFTWFYCLKAVTIELPNKTQLKVYVSSTVPLPMPGEKLAAFNVGYSFGQKRFMAVVYAPHVAVVRGT